MSLNLNMQSWNGKIAVVTGASSGIGAAIAKTLAENGLIVIGLARRFERVKELAEKTKGKIHAIKCDLMNENEISDVFRSIENNFGGIDLLINNAAIFSSSGLVDGSVEEWKQTITTNVLSLSICTKEALKSMRKRGDNGHIVHINSIAGHQTCTNIKKTGMYTASKNALTSLTHSLKFELNTLKSNIKVTSLSPGIVYTDMAINALKDLEKIDITSTDGSTPDAFLTAKDLADMLLFIISVKPHIEIQELTLRALGSPY